MKSIFQKRVKQVTNTQMIAAETAQTNALLGEVAGTKTDTQRARDRATFAAQASTIRRQLRRMERCVVLPQGKFMKQWDKVTLFALIFTAFATPWEVGLLETTLEPDGVHMFILNRVVDTIFIIDIGINFFIPYRDREGLMVFDNKLIAKSYATSWFPLDIVASVPYDSILLALRGGASAEGGGGSSAAGLRVMKMLRLIKLVRILRASRIIKRWQTFIGMSHAFMQVIIYHLTR